MENLDIADLIFKERIQKLKALSAEQREKQVFEWIKTGVINLREFQTIIDVDLI